LIIAIFLEIYAHSKKNSIREWHNKIIDKKFREYLKLKKQYFSLRQKLKKRAETL